MSLSRRMIWRSFFLALWALVMTTATVILGAPPLRLLRLAMGRLFFWTMTCGLSLIIFGLGWKSAAILFLILVFFVGCYSEFLALKWHPIFSAAISVALTSILAGCSFYLWKIKLGQNWYTQLLDSVKNSVNRVPIFQKELNLSIEDLLLQAPSGFVILLLMTAAVLLTMEPKIREWLGNKEKINSNYLKEFRLPDVFVWLTIFSLLGTFLKIEPKWLHMVGINLLNVCVVLFFFQGFAVFISIFDWLKMSYFWRILWTILLILQLFIVVSVVGLVDYWMDFRYRFERRAKQFNKPL